MHAHLDHVRWQTEAQRGLDDALQSIKLSDRGVFVQASTLGSLEALLEYLRSTKVKVGACPWLASTTRHLWELCETALISCLFMLRISVCSIVVVICVCSIARTACLTPSLSWCHLKTTNKSPEFQTFNLKVWNFGLLGGTLSLSLSVFFFAMACERTFIKTNGSESSFVIGLENTLSASTSLQPQAQKCHQLGQWKG